MAPASILMDSSSAIFGTRSMLGEIVPSFSSGINDVPRYGKSDIATTKTTREAATVLDG